MAKSTVNAENVLSTLSTEARTALELHYRQQVASEIASGLAAPKAPKARRTVSKEEGGVNKSEFIRSCDDDMSVKDVVAKAAEAGIEISAALVYNVRANAKKAEARAADVEAEAKRQEEVKEKKRAALVAARAAKVAKKEEAEKAANAKTAAKSKKEEAETAAKSKK